MSGKEIDKDTLRTKAETIIAQEQLKLANPQSGEELLHQLLHELRVHQVELEMQNEALRQAQTAMEESRDRYVDLYDFAPIGYLTLTREGMISEINLTGADMLGVLRQKLHARRFSQLVATEDRERWYLHFASVLKYDQRQRCELMFQRGDGSRFHAQLDSVRVSASPGSSRLDEASSAHLKDGGVFSVRIALTDIAERTLAESAIKDARELAESIVDTVRAPLVVLDDALIVSVSRSFCQYFHVIPEATKGRQIYELGNRQWDMPELRELLETILPGNEVIENFEVEHDFPDIGRRKMLLNARRITGKTDGTQLTMLAMEDATGRV